MNKLVEALPNNIVAERHEMTGKWVLWYLTDEQATKAMRVLAEHRAEPSFICENGSKFNLANSGEKFTGQPEPSAYVPIKYHKAMINQVRKGCDGKCALYECICEPSADVVLNTARRIFKAVWNYDMLEDDENVVKLWERAAIAAMQGDG